MSMVLLPEPPPPPPPVVPPPVEVVEVEVTVPVMVVLPEPPPPVSVPETVDCADATEALRSAIPAMTPVMIFVFMGFWSLANNRR
jgi:hypothetical protein